MNKKEIKEDILRMITQMECNTFLLPDSWSENIQMQHKDYMYRTYVGTRGNSRYINLEKYIGNEKQLSILFRGNKIELSDGDIFKPINIKEIYNFIKEVYDELHSFKNHNEGARRIRKEISSRLQTISNAQNDIKKLKQQLEDLNQLT